MVNTSYGVELGGNCNGHYEAYDFKGSLDDVRIYGRALSPAEIVSDMTTPVGGANPPPDTAAPSTPTGLAASGVTTTQATLTWNASTDNVGVAGYRVFRDGALVGTVTTTSYTANGLAASSTYSFTVAAFDAAGNASAQSTPRQVTTPSGADTSPPSRPMNLVASGVTASQVTVSWQASTDNVGVAGYRVYRNGSLIGTVTTTSYTSTGLTANTTYSFTVAAFDAAQNSSAQSSPLQVTTSPPPSDTTPPTVPTGLTSSNVTTTQATLSWQASSDNVSVAGYRIYRNGSLAGTSSTTSHTATGLAASTTYSFTVSAFDAAGNASAQSTALSVTTASTPPPAGSGPLAAYSFDETAGTMLADRSGNNRPGTLVNGPLWTAGRYNGGLAFDGVNDYVTMGDIPQADALTRITVSAWVKFAAVAGGNNETHFVDKSLCAGNAGGGPWELGAALTQAHKAEFVIYPQNGQPNTYVFSGPSTTSIDDGAWHYVTGRYDGVNLSVWVDGNLESSRPVANVTMRDTAYAVELGGHCNGHYEPYDFKGSLDDVRIYSRALSAAEIATDMVTPVGGGGSQPPDTAAPSTPTGLASSNVTSSQATLSWQASSDNVGVAGYRVYRNGTLAGTVTTTGYTATGLAANTTYAFTVAAFDAAGNSSAQSAPLQVTTSASPGGTSYSTTFGASENPISEGGRWINGQATGLDWHNVRTTPGKAFGADFAPGYDDDIAHLNTSFTPNQYAEATVYRAPGYSPGVNHEVELLLRFKITPHNARGYEVLWSHQGHIAIVRWNGPLGDYTPLLDNVQIGPAVDGDVLRAEIINGVVRVYRNGTLVATGPPDNTWIDGQPGIGFWPKPGAIPENYGWRRFEAGNR
jgi:chitodextrinase